MLYCSPSTCCRCVTSADNIFLTIEVGDTKDVSIKFTDSTLEYRAKSSTGDKSYELDYKLAKKINPEQSKWAQKGRGAEVVLKKADDSQGWWNKLLEDKNS